MHSPISCRVTIDLCVVLAAWTISRPPSAPLWFCWLLFLGRFYSIMDVTTLYVENESLHKKTAGSEVHTVHVLTHPDLLPLLIMTGHLHDRKATKYKLNCLFVSVPTRPFTLSVIPGVSDTNERIHRRRVSEPWLRTLHHPVRQSLQWLSPISLSPSFVTCWECIRPPQRRQIYSAPTT